jgi:maltose O-acetyltransferase
MRIISRIIHWIKFINWKRKLKANGTKLVNPTNIMCYQNLQIGKNVYIGPESYIMGKGGLVFGDNVIVGPRLTVWTENHNYKSEKMIPYDMENFTRPIIIGANVWIGFGVTLCPGVEIGEGCIIGMGAVVRGKIPPCSIVIGNPSIIVGKRNEEIYYKLLAEQKIYTWHNRIK